MREDRIDPSKLRRLTIAEIKMKIAFACLSICGLFFPVLCFGLHFSGRGEVEWSEFFAAPFATVGRTGWEVFAYVWMPN